MKKMDLKKVALLGLTAGIACAAPCMAETPTNGKTNGNGNGNGNGKQTTNPQSMTMTEEVLIQKLNPEGKNTYYSLNPEGKALALKLANQSCQGKNDCKGLNSCKTTENSCAGKGGCKGKSPGPFKDLNQAVNVAAQKMAEKRAQISQ